MEFALVLRELSRRRLLLALGVPIAALAAMFSVYRLEGSTLKSRSLQYSSASTQLLVDTPSSVLGNLSKSFEPLNARATVFANFMTSPAVLKLIGQHAGIPGDQIYAAGPVDELQPRAVQEPTALKRNVQITGETDPYRLNFNITPDLPTINVFSQAPTTKQAVGLANSAVVGLREYVANLENAEHTPAASRVTIRQLGPANGNVVDGGISKTLMVIVFIATFLLWCILLLAATRFRQNWRASAVLADAYSRGEDEAEHAAPERPAEKASDNGVTPMPRRPVYAPDADPFEVLSATTDEHAAVGSRRSR